MTWILFSRLSSFIGWGDLGISFTTSSTITWWSWIRLFCLFLSLYLGSLISLPLILSDGVFLSFGVALSKFKDSLIVANFWVILNPSNSKLGLIDLSAGRVSNYLSVVVDLRLSIGFLRTSHSSNSDYFNIMTLLLLPWCIFFSVILRLVSRILLSLIRAKQLIEYSACKI